MVLYTALMLIPAVFAALVLSVACELVQMQPEPKVATRRRRRRRHRAIELA